MRYLKGISTLKIDQGICTGCGFCLNVCPHDVIVLAGKKAEVRDLDACMECGACAKNCPSGAIAVQAGVGCAYAIINGMITGGPPDCGCGEGGKSSCCS
jgi:NAD-dependent dihydropyrimidine dehydrogenase PreA subunit